MKVGREVDAQEVAGSEWTAVPLKRSEQVTLPWISPGQPNSILEILAILI